MSNLLYLGIAVALSAVGILLIWWRNRRPTSVESGIEDFRRELRALSPDPAVRPDGPRAHGEDRDAG